MSVTLAAWRVRPYFQTRTIRVSATGNDVTSAHKPRPPQPDTAVHRANESAAAVVVSPLPGSNDRNFNFINRRLFVCLTSVHA